MVVVGIIAILISILIPVIGRVRQAAYAANSLATVNQIRSAIDVYYSDHRAYPGPFSNDQIINGVTISPTIGYGTNAGNKFVTMTENLTLGLLGGLIPNNSAPYCTYLPANIGKGPMQLVATNQAMANSYLAQASTLGILSASPYADQGGTNANGTNIPVFIDNFPDPMPILYMRARAGAPGIISPDPSPPAVVTSANYQFDLAQITPYTKVKLDGKIHGLQIVGTSGTSYGWSVDLNKVKDVPPLDALPYLRDQTRDTSGNYLGTNDYTGTPRQHDAYLLISAGIDRIYGTFDDICNFGSVHP